MLDKVKPKVYETFAEQKIDQRIGFVAFPIVNAIVWVAVVLLSRWVDSITVEPTVRHPNLRLAIALLPWVVNGLVLLWAAIFRRYIASGYLVFLGGLLVVGMVLGLIGVVSFFLAVPLTALTGSAGALFFMMVAIITSTWFMLKVMPMFRNWWKL
jgi:hypothetical protein